MLDYFPKYFSSRAIALYVGVVIIVSAVFHDCIMSWYLYLFGIIEVFCFFYFSTALTKKWAHLSEKAFKKRLFETSLIIRLVWVLFSYWFYNFMTGQPFEFNTADALYYHQVGTGWMVRPEGLASTWYGLYSRMRGGLSDTGYPLYLIYFYKIFGNEILFPRIVKALLSAYTCLLLYKIATRNFGDKVARITGIFCMLMPNLIYYCGLHLKETEMLFLIVAFIDRADYTLRNNKFTVSNLLLTVLLAISLFFFRTVLGAVALFSFFTALIFSSSRIIKIGKKLALVIWFAAVVGYFATGILYSDVENIWNKRKENQTYSMQFYAEREGGNKFVKNSSGYVFVPLIFIIPFPTIVDTPQQENMKLFHGGYYIKDITAFFTIFALFWVIINRKWREYSLIGSFTLGYLMVIALSGFAHSERFHIPTLPFELMMATFGISLMTNKGKKYFNYYLLFIAVVIVGWSWFKLAGKGLI